MIGGVYKKPRRWQREVSPVELPPQLRARLDRVTGRILADRFKREEVFAAYRPKLAIALAEDHVAQATRGPRLYHIEDATVAAGNRCADRWFEALKYTIGQHHALQRSHLTRAFDEQQIRDFADNYAAVCARRDLAGCEKFVRVQGIDPPEGRNLTETGALARMQDALWWRRKLRAAWTRRAENVMRELGIVRKRREPYASDDAVRARMAQTEKGRRFLENHEAVNERGEQLNLLELAEHSNANPAIRRAEFMTRVAGFEEIARDAGHVAQFWTLTTPSAFHAWNADGEKNAQFQRFLVREGQAWLCKQWARVRAKLKRLSILIYGFRVAEPHHDGTPHWHLLIFVRPRDAETVERVVRSYWLKEYKDEKGAQKHRVKLKTIDADEGSAAGYIAKYVSKNIDGAGAIGQDTDYETDRPVVDGVRRVHAWAALHGIRQFQQIGGPPVGLWRELRRITEVSRDLDIERARARADVGDWAGFIRCVSFEGIRAGRKVDLKLARRETGELTKYSEERAAPIIGVRAGSRVEISRPHLWHIQKCGTEVPKPVELLGLHKCGTYAFHEVMEKPPLNPACWAKVRRIVQPCAVMNPPTSPAADRDVEARNRNQSGDAGHTGAGRRSKPWAAGGAGPASPVSFMDMERAVRAFHKQHDRYPTLEETRAAKFSSGSFSFSALGPVAITVRGSESSLTSGAALATGPPLQER